MLRRRLIAGTVALIPVVCALWLQGRNAKARPSLMVIAGDLDMGEQWIQSELKRSVTVKNPTDATVVVRNVRASCNCTQVEPRSFSLAPGETRELTLVIDLQPPHSIPVGKSISFKVVIDFQMGDGTTPPPIELSAQVRSPFVITPRSIDFGRRLSNDAADVESFSIECLAPMESVDVATDVDGVEFRSERVEEGRFRVDAFISPGRQPRPLTGLIKVTGQTKPDCVSVTDRLRMNGEVISEVSVEPSHVAFGILPLGQAAEQQVSLRSRVGGSIEIVTVQPEASDISVEMMSAADQPVVAIRQTAWAKGHQKSVVNLTYRLTTIGGTEVTTTIPVTYFGD